MPCKPPDANPEDGPFSALSIVLDASGPAIFPSGEPPDDGDLEELLQCPRQADPVPGAQATSRHRLNRYVQVGPGRGRPPARDGTGAASEDVDVSEAVPLCEGPQLLRERFHTWQDYTKNVRRVQFGGRGGATPPTAPGAPAPLPDVVRPHYCPSRLVPVRKVAD